MPPAHQLDLPLQFAPALSTEVSLSRDEAGRLVIEPRATIREWGRTAEAADILGVSPETVRQMVHRGELPHRTPGRRWIQVDLIAARMRAQKQSSR